MATTSFGGFVQAGIQFAITPHISAANYLRLEYQIQLNSFAGPPMQTGEVTIPPPRDTNLVQSEATVPDGHTIIIGGLRRTIDQETIDKVPLLGDVPLLGYLFRNRIRTNTTSTLYVFIRPLILRDDRFRDLKLISDEEVAATDMDRDWPQNPAVAIGSGEHRDPWESPTIPHLPAGE